MAMGDTVEEVSDDDVDWILRAYLTSEDEQDEQETPEQVNDYCISYISQKLGRILSHAPTKT